MEVPTTPTQKFFKSRPNAPAFVPSSSNGLANMPQATSPAFSIPTRGRGGPIRVAAPSLSTDVAFQPTMPKADENSFLKHDQHDYVNKHEENTVFSSIQHIEQASSIPGHYSEIQNNRKPAVEIKWGRPLPISELSLGQRIALGLEKPVSTDDFVRPNSKPPHLRGANDLHLIPPGSTVVMNLNSEANEVHGKNLVVIKDFARRAEAVRRGDPSAITSTNEEGEGDERILPAVSY